MKVGITLPQFRRSPDDALAAASVAEASGLDGVFVFDHLWAIGKPDRPCVNAYVLLGALAGATTRVAVGSLVARVSLLPNATLVHSFETLHRMLGDRLIAGLGTGDRLSVSENEALGIPFGPPDERRADLAECCDGLRARGIRTWVGASQRSHATRDVALRTADAVNYWDVDPAVIAAERDIEVTWAGPPPAGGPSAAHLRSLADAGASWAIYAPVYPPGDGRSMVETVASAAGGLA